MRRCRYNVHNLFAQVIRNKLFSSMHDIIALVQCLNALFLLSRLYFALNIHFLTFVRTFVYTAMHDGHIWNRVTSSTFRGVIGTMKGGGDAVCTPPPQY